jgi:2-dehydropantoate 2-reductase
MHFVIYGVGSVGGFYACKLANFINYQDKHKLTLIARKNSADKIRQSGTLKMITSVEDEIIEVVEVSTKKVNIVENLSEVEFAEDETTAILLCVKSKDTLNASEDIKTIFNPANMYVVSVQNGIDNEEKIESILGEGAAIGCITNVAAETAEAGIYLQKHNTHNQYRIIVGELGADKQSERITKLKETLKDANINISISDDIKHEMWRKLVWNSAFNPVSALYGECLGDLLKDEQKGETVLSIMRETTKVAQAEGIALADDTPEMHFNKTNRKEWASFKTSMLQDAEKSKALEVDELLGIIIKKASKHNIETPTAQKVYNQLKEKFSFASNP